MLLAVTAANTQHRVTRSRTGVDHDIYIYVCVCGWGGKGEAEGEEAAAAQEKKGGCLCSLDSAAKKNRQ